MPRKKDSAILQEMKEMLHFDEDYLRPMVKRLMEEVMEEEMTDLVGVGKHERSGDRKGYRSGHYERTLFTRVGKLELRVPRDREGKFSTEIFERYQRSEKALVSSLAEMYIQGVSTRKVKKITETLCGNEFSSSTVSRINAKLDDQLKAFHERKLEETMPYLILDARYERVRENHVIRKRAVMIAIGINEEGRRTILGVELANRESRSSWSDFLTRLKERGLKGVEFVASDDHAGLKAAIGRLLPEALWQRCYVHFLRNALDHLPRKTGNDCLRELRLLYDRRDIEEAYEDLSQWLGKWRQRYPKLCDWVEENIGETFSFYRLPREHHKHMRSTNMLERLNEEIKRRTQVIRIFPNEKSCLRLVRALAVEVDENWIEAPRYLNMSLYIEHKKALMREEAKQAKKAKEAKNRSEKEGKHVLA